MVVDYQQLEKIRYSFTDLGRTIKDISKDSEGLLSDTLKSLKEGFQPLLESLSKEMLQSLSSVSAIQNGYRDQAEANVWHREFFLKSANSLEKSSKILIDINNMDKFSEMVKKGPFELSMKFYEKDGKIHSSVNVKPIETTKGKEYKAIKGQLKSFATKIHLPTPGNAIATILGVVAFGYMEEDRIKKESGEVENVLMEAYDSGAKGAVAKGTSYLSQLQEKFQKFYGIAKEETQSVAAAFVRGGVGLQDMFKRVEMGIKGVKDNYTTFSFAIDKMFNLAGGTTATRMVEMMADYGKSLDEARVSTMKLMMAGKDSGIGTQQFAKNVETAGSTLQKFGFDIDDVIDLAVNLQEGFEKMGVPKQFAGRQAALGLQQVAGAITNMSDEMAVFLGEEMGMGEGLEARQNMMESWQRVAKGDSTEELMGMIGKLSDFALKQAKGDKTRAGFFLEKFMGVGIEGSKAMLMIKEALDKGEFDKAKEIAQNNMKEFREAFMTERKKQSEFQQNLNEVLKGVSEIGSGILALVGDVAAYVILTFKQLYAKGGALFESDDKKKKEIEDRADEVYKKISKNMDAHGEKVLKGFDKWTDGLSKMGKDFLGDSFAGLKQAWAFDPYGASSQATTFQPGETAPMVRTVPVVINAGGGDPGERQRYGLTPGLEMVGGREGGDQEEWVGGGLEVVAEGSDPSGDITVSIVGNCPRCGLLFGDSSADYEMADIAGMGFSESDVEAMARMLSTEMGGDEMRGKRETEASAIGWTAINRLRDPKSRFGSSLSDVITGGHGYGKQGKDRSYGTSKKATEQSTSFARDLLSGKIADPTQGATFFYHSRPGGTYSGGKDRPDFTLSRENTLNLNIGKGREARFYSDRSGAKEDPRQQELDEYYTSKGSGKSKGWTPAGVGEGF